MRAVIAGGAGFLGSHLCDFLLSQGHTVVCIDNLITGSIDNIRHLIPGKDFEFIQQDITEPIRIPGRIDYVLHLASPASPVDYLKFPVETMKAGSLGTLNALEMAKTKKAMFLLASTSEVYGDPLQNPQKEEYWGNVNPVGPRSVYDEAKRFSEALTMAFHRQDALDVRIARIFNTCGERMRRDDGRAIPTFITQAIQGQPITIFGDGTQTRSFCYVSDLISGLVKLMDAKDIAGEVFNLGNPEEVSIAEVARLIKELAGSSSPIVFTPALQDDPQRRKPDITKAKERLEWQPVIGLKESLQRTLSYFVP